MSLSNRYNGDMVNNNTVWIFGLEKEVYLIETELRLGPPGRGRSQVLLQYCASPVQSLLLSFADPICSGKKN